VDILVDPYTFFLARFLWVGPLYKIVMDEKEEGIGLP